MTWTTNRGRLVWRDLVAGGRAFVVPPQGRYDRSVRGQWIPNRDLVRVGCHGCDEWAGRGETWRRCAVFGTMTRHDDACASWGART